VLSLEDMRALLKACAGRQFADRRDTAVIWLLADTGIRRSEAANLTVADIDLPSRTVSVMGKGRRPRMVRFGPKTAQALDRYLRVRDAHARAEEARLWLGASGRRFTDEAIRQMLERRGEQAGVKVHAHQFRHSFAHRHLANGGHEGDLMMLAGWKSRQMLSRYGAALAAERARDNYRSPWEEL
jgi:site-specific recombinase XerD